MLRPGNCVGHERAECRFGTGGEPAATMAPLSDVYGFWTSPTTRSLSPGPAKQWVKSDPLLIHGVMMTKPAGGTLTLIAEPFRPSTDTGDPTWAGSVE